MTARKAVIKKPPTKDELIDQLGKLDLRIAGAYSRLETDRVLRATLVEQLDALGELAPEPPEDPHTPTQHPETPTTQSESIVFDPLADPMPQNRRVDLFQAGQDLEGTDPGLRPVDSPSVPDKSSQVKLLSRNRKDPVEQQEMGPYMAVLIEATMLDEAPSVAVWLLNAPEGWESHLMWAVEEDDHKGVAICGREGPYTSEKSSWAPPAEPWPHKIIMCVVCLRRGLPHRADLQDDIYREIRALYGQRA